ncbi:MAG TPA: GNAT family protein [Chloroflexota bacterium]|nr:GNAT family protein [Chloroflexota bacterium]
MAGHWGEVLDWRPAAAPERAVHDGRLVRLEPLDPARHGSALYQAAQGSGADPALWDYLSVGPFAGPIEFITYLKECALSRDPLFFAIVDRRTEAAVGMLSYLRITPAHGVIEIGHIWFGTSLQRTPGATEAIYLLARHAFDDLGYRRLEWKCDSLNARSRRAAERFGFRYEGLFRQHLVVKGRNRDTTWFAILDAEWPRIRAAFEKWLAPDNFDANGQQRATLGEIREGE